MRRLAVGLVCWSFLMYGAWDMPDVLGEKCAPEAVAEQTMSLGDEGGRGLLLLGKGRGTFRGQGQRSQPGERMGPASRWAERTNGGTVLRRLRERDVWVFAQHVLIPHSIHAPPEGLAIGSDVTKKTYREGWIE